MSDYPPSRRRWDKSSEPPDEGTSMKIVVISHAAISEPSRVRWLRLAEYDGIHVTLLVPRRWGNKDLGAPTQWETKPFQTGRFQVLPVETDIPIEGTRYRIRGIRAILDQLEPDIVHVAQDESSMTLQQVIDYRRFHRRQLKISLFSWNNIHRHVTLSTPMAWLRWRRVCRWTDLALAGSHEITRVLQAGGYVKPIRVQTEIGVDTSLFFRREDRRAEIRAEFGVNDDFLIVFGGRITVEKGVLDLAHALHSLPGRWRCMFLGKGPEQDNVLNILKSNASRVIMPGIIPLERMPDYMSAADVLVLPSQTHVNCKEQFGLVLAQAMACGVPVIGSSSGSIAEVIGGAGLVVAEREPASLAQAIQLMMEHEVLQHHFAKAGLERVRQKYDAGVLASQTCTLFEALVSGKSLPTF